MDYQGLLAALLLLSATLNQCQGEEMKGSGVSETKAPTGSSIVASIGSTSMWREEVRLAVEGATERFQTNLVTVLNGLANTTVEAGQNVTVAIATLTRAVVTDTFDLVGVVAYMPKLLLLDLPNQFVEVLRLIRRNEVRIPTDVNGAIDSILAMTRAAEESGIRDKIFEPIARFLPNMLTGVQDFLQTIIGTLANVFGAGVERFDPHLDTQLRNRYLIAAEKDV